MSRAIEYRNGTEELLTATVTSKNLVLSDDLTVELRYDGTDEGWFPAVWLGVAGKSRRVQTAEPVTLAEDGEFEVEVRVTADPEVPIIKAGDIVVAS